MITVEPPNGVILSDDTLTGSYDTTSTWPLAIGTESTATITGVTIDGDPATITEGIVNVPYTAQEIVITGTVTTVTGTETVTLTYSLDVVQEPLRLVAEPLTYFATDQFQKNVTGSRDNPIGAVALYRNGSRVAWNQKSRYSYKISYDGETWSDGIEISRNSSGCTIAFPVGTQFYIKVFYDYNTTHEASDAYYVNTEFTGEYDEDITLVTEMPNVTIDNENRTVYILADVDENIEIYPKLGDDLMTTSNVATFFCNKWLYTIRQGEISSLHTAGDIRGATKLYAYDQTPDVDPHPFSVPYDLTVNTQHVTLSIYKIPDDPSSANVTLTGVTSATGTATGSFKLGVAYDPASADLTITLDGEPLAMDENDRITIPTSSTEQILYLKATKEGYVDTEITCTINVTEATP